MSTRLLLDGQDLRALMLRVRDEMGPGATIVRAERVRTGGIAGFFAREHYELTVEVPDPPERPPPRSRPAPPLDAARPDGQVAEAVGLEALLAAADSAPVRTIYEANTGEAIRRSVFGSPTYFVDGDMFYGQDHLEMVERALKKPYQGRWPVD